MEDKRTTQFNKLEQKLGRKFSKVNERFLKMNSKTHFVSLETKLKEIDKDELFFALVSSNPRLISGSLGNAYIVFELIDLETLSFVTPTVLALNIKYSRDINLKSFNLPNSLEVVLCRKAKVLPGIETYSRSSLFLEYNIQCPNLMKIGITEEIQFCKYTKCSKIIDKNKFNLCETHYTQKLERIQGQRMELASGTYGFKLFNYNKTNKGHTQYTELKGAESYLFDNEETITLYPSLWNCKLNHVDDEKRELQLDKIRSVIASVDNHGGQMAKDSLAILNKQKRHKETIKQVNKHIQGIKRNEPLSLEACNILARKAIQASSLNKKPKNSNLPSGRALADKLKVYDTLADKQKLKALINNINEDKNGAQLIFED